MSVCLSVWSGHIRPSWLPQASVLEGKEGRPCGHTGGRALEKGREEVWKGVLAGADPLHCSLLLWKGCLNREKAKHNSVCVSTAIHQNHHREAKGTVVSWWPGWKHSANKSCRHIILLGTVMVRVCVVCDSGLLGSLLSKGWQLTSVEILLSHCVQWLHRTRCCCCCWCKCKCTCVTNRHAWKRSRIATKTNTEVLLGFVHKKMLKNFWKKIQFLFAL